MLCSAVDICLTVLMSDRYENNLTNVTLFANLTLEGMHELVPGRLFTTRCNHLLFFVGIC